MTELHIVRTIDASIVKTLPESAPLAGRRVEIVMREIGASVLPATYNPDEPVPDGEPDWDPDAIERVRFRVSG